MTSLAKKIGFISSGLLFAFSGTIGATVSANNYTGEIDFLVSPRTDENLKNKGLELYTVNKYSTFDITALKGTHFTDSAGTAKSMVVATSNAYDGSLGTPSGLTGPFKGFTSDGDKAKWDDSTHGEAKVKLCREGDVACSSPVKVKPILLAAILPTGMEGVPVNIDFNASSSMNGKYIQFSPGLGASSPDNMWINLLAKCVYWKDNGTKSYCQDKSGRANASGKIDFASSSASYVWPGPVDNITGDARSSYRYRTNLIMFAPNEIFVGTVSPSGSVTRQKPASTIYKGTISVNFKVDDTA